MNEQNWKSRTELLLGTESVSVLNNAHVLIAGVGGVGGFAAEQLCRAGVGSLTLVDNDIVQPTNLNRQIAALNSTQGRLKVEVLGDRLRDINPEINLNVLSDYLDADTIPQILKGKIDFIVDAIDTLTPKVLLLKYASGKGYSVVSSMGSGGKTDPSLITSDDISNSHHCRFAYMIRKYLHRYGIREGITVVYSPEQVVKKKVVEVTGLRNKRSVVGTISYMPAIFGCLCAAIVVRKLTGLENITSPET